MVVTGSKGEEEKVERGKVAEIEEPEFGEERNRAGWVKKKKKNGNGRVLKMEQEIREEVSRREGK